MYVFNLECSSLPSKWWQACLFCSNLYKAKTCDCGATTGTALGHSYSSTCTASSKEKHYQVCTRCKAKVYSVHTYTSSTTQKATCTTTGIKAYKCKYCGFTYTQTIAATGHDYKNAGYTYLDSNRHYQECNTCGTKLYGNHTIKDGKCTLCKYVAECKHTGVISVPTCTEAGYCDNCEQAVKPALGHDYQPTKNVTTKKTAV